MTVCRHWRRNCLRFFADGAAKKWLRRVVADAFVDFPKPIEDLAIPALFAALADALARLAGAPSVTRRFPAKAQRARQQVKRATGPVDRLGDRLTPLLGTGYSSSS